MHEASFLEQTDLIYECRNTPDGVGAPREAGQEYLVFAVVEVEVVANEAISIADVGVDPYGRSAYLRM